MKGSYLTKIFGAGVVLASVAVLPVTKPSHAADANNNGFTQYQLGRHSMGEHGGMMADMDSHNSTCYGGNSMSPQEMYDYNRHAMGEELIVTSSRTMRMMDSANMTNSDTQSASMHCQTNETSPEKNPKSERSGPENSSPVPGAPSTPPDGGVQTPGMNPPSGTPR